MATRLAAPQAVDPSAWALPDPAMADSEGLVALGADLEVETLVDAYRRGIFPWPHDGVPLPWFSPDPRGIVDVHLDGAVRSRSLRQRMRRSGWTTTVDADFAAVIDACARRPGLDDTWINADMRNAYRRLHSVGWAHSVEVWSADERLVGGLYGVSVGGCFTGESMFHLEPDASKVAFVDLVERWAEAGGSIVDVQLPTPHLASLGARATGRAGFLARLAELRDDSVRMAIGRLPVSRLAGPIAS